MPIVAAAVTALGLVLYQVFVLQVRRKMAMTFFTTYFCILLGFFFYFPGVLDYSAVVSVAAFVVFIEATLIFVTRKLESIHEREP